MANKNFTNQLCQYAQSIQDPEYPQIQGFTDGYKQAVLDLKAILQEQEGKGYKSFKDHLWKKVNGKILRNPSPLEKRKIIRSTGVVFGGRINDDDH